MSGANAKRLFHGIQGDKHNKGELFGIENMFRFRSGNKSLTEDIIKVRSIFLSFHLHIQRQDSTTCYELIFNVVHTKP